MTAQEMANRPLWDAGFLSFLFLEKQKSADQASGLHHLVASTAVVLPHTLMRTHNKYTVFVTLTHTANNLLYEDVVEAL